MAWTSMMWRSSTAKWHHVIIFVIMIYLVFLWLHHELFVFLCLKCVMHFVFNMTLLCFSHCILSLLCLPPPPPCSAIHPSLCLSVPFSDSFQFTIWHCAFCLHCRFKCINFGKVQHGRLCPRLYAITGGISLHFPIACFCSVRYFTSWLLVCTNR